MRVFFWFLGVDPNREGGPWWFRDFPSRAEADKFFTDIKPFLHAWAKTDTNAEIDTAAPAPPRPFVKFVND